MIVIIQEAYLFWSDKAIWGIDVSTDRVDDEPVPLQRIQGGYRSINNRLLVVEGDEL